MSRHDENMSPGSDLIGGTNYQQPIFTGSSNGRASGKRNHRKRLRLSCGECRNKKISCDRNLPCHRCVRSGRPEECSFEAGTKPFAISNNVTQTQHKSDQIRELQTEVAQLKVLLSKAGLQHDKSPGNSAAETLHDKDTVESAQTVLPNEGLAQEQSLNLRAHATDTDPSDPKERSPQGYYRQHTLFQLFHEIPQLFLFINETADEWFKPRGVSLRKAKLRDAAYPEVSRLENLLPPKNDTDALVSFYLKNLEHLHRVVHVPTFKREYANFWVSERVHYPTMTALVLAMISISTCASVGSSDSTCVASAHRSMPPRWVSACDGWLSQQSSKGRKLIYYQISCLVYLAKRMNTIRKKRFWNETGSLIQNAVLDRLHCDSSQSLDSPYMREMKRRIWAVLRELDLQNAFEYELPTLLHNINSNVAAPANLDDEDFDTESKVLPPSKPSNQYTCTSYQFHSSRSWSLRVEISRRLLSTGSSKALSYEDVLRYTQEITQALDSLPSWTTQEEIGSADSRLPLLSSAFLQFQLKECILAIHLPYLQRGSSRCSFSEIFCYHTSRDILLLNKELGKSGIQSLTLLREDLLIASLSITHITMLQPRDSTSVTMASSESTVDILEQCLPFVEERYLRCFYGEPWCPLTMCGAIMLLKIHLGKESRHRAKASCAQRFLGLYYQHFARQHPCLLNRKHSPSQEALVNTGPAPSQLPTSSVTDFPVSELLDSGYLDLGIDFFDLDVDWDGIARHLNQARNHIGGCSAHFLKLSCAAHHTVSIFDDFNFSRNPIWVTGSGDNRPLTVRLNDEAVVFFRSSANSTLLSPVAWQFDTRHNKTVLFGTEYDMGLPINDTYFIRAWVRVVENIGFRL